MPDIEIALMHTKKDTVLRLASSFTVPRHRPNHWYHIWGTGGVVESARSDAVKGKMWLAGKTSQSGNPEDMEWDYVSGYLPQEAIGSGHGNADYFPAAAFIKSIIEDTVPPLDIYKSVEITAPAIAASISAAKGGNCVRVPDFRPGAHRVFGQLPKDPQ